jgi:hypothetical protein
VSVLEIAKSQLGVSEDPKGSNWGSKVKEYLKAGGCAYPAPWCVAFVVWCFRQAGFGNTKLPTSASSTYLLNWAREQGHLCKSPLPGDIFLLLRPGGKSAFHCGLVSSVGSLTFKTLEGNSNSVGSPEGYEVVSRTRNKFVKVAFVRING